MTRAELVQEVIDRGWDYTKSARIGGFVERAYQTLCARHAWTFLETESSGEAPRELTDLRKILTVTDTTAECQLRGVDRRWAASTFPNLTDTGTPEFWYLENKTLKTYPVSTNTISVRYLRVPTVLGDSDTPLVPSEWQYLIVDRAVVDCLKDDDEYEQARALRAEVSEAIDTEMVPALFNRNLQNSASIERTGYFLDYQ